MLKIEIAVTIIAVAGPNIIRLASDMPKFTETLPVFGSGAERLSAVKMRTPNKTIPIKDAKLQLGRWQGIMLFELDGPRKRDVVVTVLGD